MDLVRTLGVAIDPTAAKAGGAEASKAFAGVGTAAKGMEAAERQAEKQTAATGDTMRKTARAGDLLRETLGRQNTILGAVQVAIDKLTAALNRDAGALKAVTSGVAATGQAMAQTATQTFNFTAKTDQAAKELKEVAVAATSAEGAIKKVGAEMERAASRRTASAAGQARAQDGRFTGGGGGFSMPGWVRGGAAALGVTIGAATALAAAKDMTMTANAVERTGNALRFASADAKDFAFNLQFVRSTSSELGLDIQSTQKEFAKFMAAGKGTEFRGDELRAVFTGVAKASAVLGLSAEETAGTLNALQQMISKGTVQAEELRGQLGERLPGAFQLAARAMGVTTEQLGKMLERGEVTAHQLLPALARELEKTFGPSASTAAKSLNSEINRLSSAWTDFKNALFNSGIGEFFTGFITLIRKTLDEISGFLTYLKREGGNMLTLFSAGLPTSAAMIAGAVGARVGAGGEFGSPRPKPEGEPNKYRDLGTLDVPIRSTALGRFRRGAGDVPVINDAELRNQTYKVTGAMDKWRVAGQETARSITSGFTDFFTSITAGTQSVTRAFRSMASSILADIGRIIATRAIAEPLANAFLGYVGLGGGVKVGGASVPTPVKHTGGAVGTGRTVRGRCCFRLALATAHEKNSDPAGRHGCAASGANGAGALGHGGGRCGCSSWALVRLG